MSLGRRLPAPPECFVQVLRHPPPLGVTDTQIVLRQGMVLFRSATVPLRLLYLVHRLPYPPNKGDKVRSFNILRQLARSGVTVLLVEQNALMALDAAPDPYALARRARRVAVRDRV